MTRRTETRVTMMTTGRAFMGTQPAASLHERSAAEDTTETTVTYVMSSVPKMHVVELKASQKCSQLTKWHSIEYIYYINNVFKTKMTLSGME
jgi:hypothetical protein